MVVAIPASALALGSWLALIPGLAFSVVIIRRTACEDLFLKVNLPGYTDYSGKVRYRLLPGIW
jgi:protein-S-isoprenylcysteine O-methyltransferase Ste14